MSVIKAIAAANKLCPKWVAQDANGSWWGFYSKPVINLSKIHWSTESTQGCVLLVNPTAGDHPDWKNSLTEVVV